jgi:hypothetical protein
MTLWVTRENTKIELLVRQCLEELFHLWHRDPSLLTKP